MSVACIPEFRPSKPAVIILSFMPSPPDKSGESCHPVRPTRGEDHHDGQHHSRREEHPRRPCPRRRSLHQAAAEAGAHHHNHASDTWACDFLQRYDTWFRPIFAFFIVNQGTREVMHFNVTRSPRSTRSPRASHPPPARSSLAPSSVDSTTTTVGQRDVLDAQQSQGGQQG